MKQILLNSSSRLLLAIVCVIGVGLYISSPASAAIMHGDFLYDYAKNPPEGVLGTQFYYIAINYEDSELDIYDTILDMHGHCPDFEVLEISPSGDPETGWDWEVAWSGGKVELPAPSFPIRWYTTDPNSALPPGEQLEGFYVKVNPAAKASVYVRTYVSDVDDNVYVSDKGLELSITPEPTTITLLGLGALALLRKRRT